MVGKLREITFQEKYKEVWRPTWGNVHFPVREPFELFSAIIDSVRAVEEVVFSCVDHLQITVFASVVRGRVW